MHARDFDAIFNAIPAIYAVFDLEWNFVAVTDAWLATGVYSREQLIGRNQFEMYPDDPNDPTSSGNATMLGGFERVLAEKVGHALPVVRYDSTDASGVFRRRYWKPVNEPVFDEHGGIRFVIHGLEEVDAADVDPDVL